uniref:PDZ domain-containing protein n=1 Tax=Panagrolaimus superbus TaxID=310955 RepID=A0A914Z7C4_9BILA
MSLISSSTEDSNDSTKSQPPEPPTIPPRPPKLNSSITNSLNYAGSFREKKAVTTEISLLLSICLESLLLAEVAGSIWIAGWSESQNSLLCHKIHVGDQLVEVNGIPVKQMKQFPSIFYNHSLPGQPVINYLKDY